MGCTRDFSSDSFPTRNAHPLEHPWFPDFSFLVPQTGRLQYFHVRSCLYCVFHGLQLAQADTDRKTKFLISPPSRSFYSTQTYLLMLNIRIATFRITTLIPFQFSFLPCLSCCDSSPRRHSLDMSQWKFGNSGSSSFLAGISPTLFNVHGVQVLFSWFLSQKDLEISHVHSLLLAQRTNLSSSKAVIICTAVFLLLVSMDFLPEYICSVHCVVSVGSFLSRFYSYYPQGGLSSWV